MLKLLLIWLGWPGWLKPYGVLCELTNLDGTMARMPEIVAFATKRQIPVVTVQDLVIYRQELTQTAI
jgi:3,4-dihydroxy 2-butanone 4-phosphate synthase